MASVVNSKGYLTHEERTADAPRNDGIHAVILAGIKLANDNVRIITLRPNDRKNGISFLSGQWLDVFCPGVPKAGGFTITSIPESARDHKGLDGQFNRAMLELAIQYSPKNPPAAWLWKPEQEIKGSTLHVRVGGSFVWPPPGISPADRKRVVLIAGGVGINPLISIMSEVAANYEDLKSVKLLYGTKTARSDCSDVLFYSRIANMVADSKTKKDTTEVQIYATPTDPNASSPTLFSKTSKPEIIPRRMVEEDIERALGEDLAERGSTIIYVCGPQAMTDEFVETVTGIEGVKPEHVLCEKWW